MLKKQTSKNSKVGVKEYLCYKSQWEIKRFSRSYIMY